MNTTLKCTLLTIIILFSTSAVRSQEQPEPVNIPATHEEVETIGSTAETKFANLLTFCLDADENLLVCDAGDDEVRKISPTGKTLARWKPGFAPFAIHACPDGTIYVAGYAIVAKLNKAGKVVKTIKADGANYPDGKPSGITATKKDVFLGVGSAGSLRSRSSVVRFNRDLDGPTIIAKDLRGCCQRLDLVAKNDALYIAENARHRINKCDRDGNILAHWGDRDPRNVEGFGSCCNPMNICFGPDGQLYTAESGMGRIKRYTPDGKFLGLVGYVGVERFNQASRLAVSCSNIAVAVTKDKSRIYVLDFKNSIIRVMAKVDSK